ncbi:MAG: acetate--CoA ligase family protein, partial [Solirubrobacteraceae bacterium]
MRTAVATSGECVAALLAPRSIAVVGASADPGKAGGRPLHYMRRLGYRGALYPVNPRRSEILGMPCFERIADLPEPVDLCVLAVPAEHVEGYVAECAEAGVRAVIVFASGYAEIGAEGAERQARLRAIALEHGMALAGPNCLGAINVRLGAAPTFTTALERRPRIDEGAIAFLTQSGAVGAFVLGLAQDEGVGLSHFVTTGNEAVLSFADYAPHLLDDPHTRVLAGYLEGLEGTDLLRVAGAALEAGKPLVLMKVGASDAGAAASAAHTGKLAGADAVYDAVFRRSGIVRARTIEELLDYSRALAAGRTPAGGGAGIVSTSGGAAILMADWCDSTGLTVTELADTTRSRLRDALPWFATGRNPVDTTGRPLWDEGMLQRALTAVAEDPGVDLVLCHVGLAPGPAGPRLAAEVEAAAVASEKPFLVCWLPEVDPGPHERLRQAGIPVFVDPARMVKAAGAVVSYAAARRRGARTPAAPKHDVAPPPPGAVVTEHAAKAWLRARGLPVTAEAVAHSSVEAVAIARELGYPACLKLLSPQILHRSDIGGVRVGLASAEAVDRAHGEILAAAAAAVSDATIEGVLVQEMAPGGQELIVSGFRDPTFGPCVLCGIGGVLAEVLADTAIRPAPVAAAEAEEMLAELRGAELLRGPRG